MFHLAFMLGAAGPPQPTLSPPPHREARPGRDDDEDEEEEGRVQPASPIVVTGRRLDAARTSIDAASGATVYALTNEAVENRPGGETGSLSDILAQAPGVVSSGRGLVVRGSPVTQVRINDVIVPDGAGEAADHLSARLAQTTRLMTGTLPAQFGFVPGGVVNVTTKSGLYQHGGQAELFVGTRGMLEPALEWSGSAGGTSLFASGSFEGDRSIVSTADGPRTRDSRQELGGLAFADHVIDLHDRVSLILGGSRERHRIGATSIGLGTLRSRDGYAIGTFQHSDDGFNLHASLFAGLTSNSAAFQLRSRERRTSLGTQVDVTQPLGRSSILRLGLLAARSSSRELEPQGRSLNLTRTSAALYVQDEWKVARAITLNPGVRIEWLRGLGSRVTIEPRVSVVWSPDEDLTAHAGYARYASAPPLHDLAAADLPDERDDYYDAGLQRAVGALTLGVDVYWREVRNFLAEHETPGAAASTPFAYRRAALRGVEFSATYAFRGTTAWANAAFSKATARSILGGRSLFSPAIVLASSRPFPLAGDRPVVMSGGVTHRFDELTLSADILMSSGVSRTLDPARPNGARAPAYAVLGLAAVYHLRLARRPTDLRIDLGNVTDVRSATSDATALEGGWTRWTRGRALLFGIEQGF